MGFQPAQNVLSVELVYWNGASYSENVLHYLAQDQMDGVQMTAFAALIRQWWTTDIKPSFPATMFLSKILMRDLTVQDGEGIEYTAGMPVPGIVVAAAMPMNVCIAVKFLTPNRGRSYRGRLFHTGLTTQNVTGDQIDGAFATLLRDKYTNLLAVKAAVGDPGWCVLSRWHNLTPRLEAYPTVITSVEVNTVIDSQRRRLLGRGI